MNLKEKLGDELFKQVKEKLGDTKVYLQSELGEDWIPKEKFNKELQKRQDAEKQIEDLKTQNSEQKTEYEKQIKEMQNGVKNLEKLTTDNEELNKQLTELREQSERTTAEYSEKLKKAEEDANNAIKETKFNSRIRDKIRSEGALKDSQLKAVLANIDIAKVSDDESLTGLTEQITGLKTSDPSFFGEVTISGDPPPAPPPPSGELSVDQIKKMTTEQILDYGVDKINAAVQK